jgi:hypothetical protein
MKAAPGLDAFQEQKVWAAGGELNVGRTDHRSAIEMRRDLGVVRLRHAGDFLGLQQAADPTQVGLQDGGGPGGEHPRELVFRGQPFSRSRDPRRPYPDRAVSC